MNQPSSDDASTRDSSDRRQASTPGGKLVLVGTPLGNRQDWSVRARQAVLGADVLFCEDTRSPQRLIEEGTALPPRISCFAHNENDRVELLLEHLRAGKTVAFISEAGMPVISDPGQVLVDAAWRHGFSIDCVPGPCAATTALCLSGFSATHSRFVGFIARHGQERTAFMQELAQERGACVIYEAGNRMRDLVRDLLAHLPDADVRRVVIARELTKVHQEVLRAPIADLAHRDFETRGEFTVVVEGCTTAEKVLNSAALRQEGAVQVLAILLDPTLRPREKARSLAQLSQGDAREIYAALFEKTKGPD